MLIKAIELGLILIASAVSGPVCGLAIIDLRCSWTYTITVERAGVPYHILSAVATVRAALLDSNRSPALQRNHIGSWVSVQ